MFEYTNYANFFFNLAIELLKNTSINKHTIKLVKSKQSDYKSIYTLCPVKSETLKTYIEAYLKTEFILLSKSLTDTSILFDKKSNRSFYLYVNY